MLPAMLMPRFMDPDKPESLPGEPSQHSLCGLQTVESTANTTIGWGVVAEAYANFGYLGRLGRCPVRGAVRALTRLSTGRAASLPMFITITATLTLFNVELICPISSPYWRSHLPPSCSSPRLRNS